MPDGAYWIGRSLGGAVRSETRQNIPEHLQLGSTGGSARAENRNPTTSIEIPEPFVDTLDINRSEALRDTPQIPSPSVQPPEQRTSIVPLVVGGTIGVGTVAGGVAYAVTEGISTVAAVTNTAAHIAQTTSTTGQLLANPGLVASAGTKAGAATAVGLAAGGATVCAVGVVTTVVHSRYNAYELKKEGLEETAINGRVIAENFIPGAIATGAAIIVAAALGATPVGWVILAGVAVFGGLYFVGNQLAKYVGKKTSFHRTLREKLEGRIAEIRSRADYLEERDEPELAGIEQQLKKLTAEQQRAFLTDEDYKYIDEVYKGQPLGRMRAWFTKKWPGLELSGKQKTAADQNKQDLEECLSDLNEKFPLDTQSLWIAEQSKANNKSDPIRERIDEILKNDNPNWKYVEKRDGPELHEFIKRWGALKAKEQQGTSEEERKTLLEDLNKEFPTNSTNTERKNKSDARANKRSQEPKQKFEEKVKRIERILGENSESGRKARELFESFAPDSLSATDYWINLAVLSKEADLKDRRDEIEQAAKVRVDAAHAGLENAEARMKVLAAVLHDKEKNPDLVTAREAYNALKQTPKEFQDLVEEQLPSTVTSTVGSPGVMNLEAFNKWVQTHQEACDRVVKKAEEHRKKFDAAMKEAERPEVGAVSPSISLQEINRIAQQQAAAAAKKKAEDEAAAMASNLSAFKQEDFDTALQYLMDNPDAVRYLKDENERKKYLKRPLAASENSPEAVFRDVLDNESQRVVLLKHFTENANAKYVESQNALIAQLEARAKKISKPLDLTDAKTQLRTILSARIESQKQPTGDIAAQTWVLGNLRVNADMGELRLREAVNKARAELHQLEIAHLEGGVSSDELRGLIKSARDADSKLQESVQKLEKLREDKRWGRLKVAQDETFIKDEAAMQKDVEAKLVAYDKAAADAAKKKADDEAAAAAAKKKADDEAAAAAAKQKADNKARVAAGAQAVLQEIEENRARGHRTSLVTQNRPVKQIQQSQQGQGGFSVFAKPVTERERREEERRAAKEKAQQAETARKAAERTRQREAAIKDKNLKMQRVQQEQAKAAAEVKRISALRDAIAGLTVELPKIVDVNPLRQELNSVRVTGSKAKNKATALIAEVENAQNAIRTQVGQLKSIQKRAISNSSSKDLEQLKSAAEKLVEDIRANKSRLEERKSAVDLEMQVLQRLAQEQQATRSLQAQQAQDLSQTKQAQAVKKKQSQENAEVELLRRHGESGRLIEARNKLMGELSSVRRSIAEVRQLAENARAKFKELEIKAQQAETSVGREYPIENEADAFSEILKNLLSQAEAIPSTLTFEASGESNLKALVEQIQRVLAESGELEQRVQMSSSLHQNVVAETEKQSEKVDIRKREMDQRALKKKAEDEAAAAAATKIQSLQRGPTARKQVEDLKAKVAQAEKTRVALEEFAEQEAQARSKLVAIEQQQRLNAWQDKAMGALKAQQTEEWFNLWHQSVDEFKEIAAQAFKVELAERASSEMAALNQKAMNEQFMSIRDVLMKVEENERRKIDIQFETESAELAQRVEAVKEFEDELEASFEKLMSDMSSELTSKERNDLFEKRLKESHEKRLIKIKELFPADEVERRAQRVEEEARKRFNQEEAVRDLSKLDEKSASSEIVGALVLLDSEPFRRLLSPEQNSKAKQRIEELVNLALKNISLRDLPYLAQALSRLHKGDGTDFDLSGLINGVIGKLNSFPIQAQDSATLLEFFESGEGAFFNIWLTDDKIPLNDRLADELFKKIIEINSNNSEILSRLSDDIVKLRGISQEKRSRLADITEIRKIHNLLTKPNITIRQLEKASEQISLIRKKYSSKESILGKINIQNLKVLENIVRDKRKKSNAQKTLASDTTSSILARSADNVPEVEKPVLIQQITAELSKRRALRQIDENFRQQTKELEEFRKKLIDSAKKTATGSGDSIPRTEPATEGARLGPVTRAAIRAEKRAQQAERREQVISLVSDAKVKRANELEENLRQIETRAGSDAEPPAQVNRFAALRAEMDKADAAIEQDEAAAQGVKSTREFSDDEIRQAAGLLRGRNVTNLPEFSTVDGSDYSELTQAISELNPEYTIGDAQRLLENIPRSLYGLGDTRVTGVNLAIDSESLDVNRAIITALKKQPSRLPRTLFAMTESDKQLFADAVAETSRQHGMNEEQSKLFVTHAIRELASEAIGPNMMDPGQDQLNEEAFRRAGNVLKAFGANLGKGARLRVGETDFENAVKMLEFAGWSHKNAQINVRKLAFSEGNEEAERALRHTFPQLAAPPLRPDEEQEREVAQKLKYAQREAVKAKLDKLDRQYKEISNKVDLVNYDELGKLIQEANALDEQFRPLIQLENPEQADQKNEAVFIRKALRGMITKANKRLGMKEEKETVQLKELQTSQERLINIAKKLDVEELTTLEEPEVTQNFEVVNDASKKMMVTSGCQNTMEMINAIKRYQQDLGSDVEDDPQQVQGFVNTLRNFNDIREGMPRIDVLGRLETLVRGTGFYSDQYDVGGQKNESQRAQDYRKIIWAERVASEILHEIITMNGLLSSTARGLKNDKSADFFEEQQIKLQAVFDARGKRQK